MRVCPYWLGYLQIIPLRKYIQDPDVILKPYIQPGMNVLEIGPGMGYFSLPMANMVGLSGKVICVDVQEKMLSKLKHRAELFGVLDNLETRNCPSDTLNIDDLKEKIDFALIFAVAHEVPDINSFFKEIFLVMKPGSKLLFSEPQGHVTKELFQSEAEAAEKCGLQIIARPEIRRSSSILFQK